MLIWLFLSRLHLLRILNTILDQASQELSLPVPTGQLCTQAALQLVLLKAPDLSSDLGT